MLDFWYIRMHICKNHPKKRILSKLNKINLTEIADYRGNLSFAEQNNPIPFDIKSVFWTQISDEVEIQHAAQIFLICLDGGASIHGDNTLELTKPNDACLLQANQKFTISPQKKNTVLLFVMDTLLENNEDHPIIEQNLLTLPKLRNFYGMNGHFANSNRSIPFDIKRVYFTYYIPESAERGDHAHKELTSLIMPIKGGFNLSTQSKHETQTTRLSGGDIGYYLQKNTWRDINKFAKNTLLLVLASDIYIESDYIRDYTEFTAILSS